MNDSKYKLSSADEYKISSELYDTILSWNRKHPSADDKEFLYKIDKYHLGTNLRGERTVLRAENHVKDLGLDFSRERFLDLGCGTGGCLLGARELGWQYSEGWEIGQAKLEFAEVNIGSKLSGKDKDSLSVLERSIDGEEAAKVAIDPFDLIICQEVLEHVKDVPKSIKTIARCLKPKKGYAYVTIPNGFSLDYVLAEPHILVFGISLLNRFDAADFAKAIKNHTHYASMMGGYYRYDHYLEQFAEHGMKYHLVNPLPNSEVAVDEMEAKLCKVRDAMETMEAEWASRIESDSMGKMNSAVNAYINEVETAISGYRSGGDKADLQQLLINYNTPMFYFVLEHQ